MNGKIRQMVLQQGVKRAHEDALDVCELTLSFASCEEAKVVYGAVSVDPELREDRCARVISLADSAIHV